ncbi:acyltransferase family protein [Croceicoccus pelagius]|uniref:Acyltransferase n=1 Tax=Croceicoccus pelagius TaxID=1703341 RepID=A0A917DHK3_9SPHN|nr:acyltransferase [Croceicoccus pelagius]GGD37591.1 acyltransferase [Croceicoccus pelagius]
MDKRLVGLDALRGVAALMVLAIHSGIPIAGGGRAVDLFFAISGFVMAMCYEDRLRGGLKPRDFLKRRFMRLWPLLAISVVLGSAAAFHQGVPLKSIAMSLPTILLFLPSIPYGDKLFFINIPAWSLHFELIANVVHAFFLQRLRNSHLLAVFVILSALSIVVAIEQGSIQSGASTGRYWMAMPHCLASYVAGILVFRYRISFRISAAIAVAALLPVAALSTLHLALSVMFVLVFAPLLVAVAAGGDVWGGKWLGAISYPLYCVHSSMLTFFGKTWGVPVSIVVAILLALIFEPTLRRRRTSNSAQEPLTTRPPLEATT